MTLIVSWIGVDQRGESSIYFASDSRISWNGKKENELEKFDFAQKIFASQKHPVIIGFCGEVIFPLIAINQIIQLIDQGLLYNNTIDSAEKRFDIFYQYLMTSRSLFPAETKYSGSFQILFASRNGHGMEAKFYIKLIEFNERQGTGRWNVDPSSPVYLEHPDKNKISGKRFVIGSGSKEFLKNYELYDQYEQTQFSYGRKRTSRGIFQCFCDTLQNIQNLECGGPPQITGLYRVGNAQNIGIIYQNERYYLGAKIEDLNDLKAIDWRNELFEIVDPRTKELSIGAKKRHNPKKLLDT